MKKMIWIFFIVIFAVCTYSLLQHEFSQKENNGNNTEEVNNEYDWLKEEGNKTVIKDEIINYLNNGGEYVVQSKLSQDEYSYKCIQINMVEHNHESQTDEYAYNILSVQMLNNEKYKNDILKELDEEKNILSYEDGCKEYDKFCQSSIIEYNSDVSKRIEMERNKNFDLMEKWCITALVKYDKEMSITDIIVYEGAIGGKLTVDNEKNIRWDVCIAEKMQYDYWGMYTQNGEKRISGYGSTSGTVYKLTLDSELEINNVEYIRKTCDNDFCQLDPDFTIYNGTSGNVYVKNFELSLEDIKSNKEFKKLVYKINEHISDDTRNKIREELGYEHLYTHLYDGIYFTKDGYVVLASRPAKYVKMTPEDFSKVDYLEWYSCFTEFLYEDEKDFYALK